jgi:hypothetical protein
MLTKKSLLASWEFSQVASELFPNAETKWQSCEVPTSVHVELIKSNRIPHPFKGLAEWDVQCECRTAAIADWQGSGKPTGCSKHLSTIRVRRPTTSIWSLKDLIRIVTLLLYVLSQHTATEERERNRFYGQHVHFPSFPRWRNTKGWIQRIDFAFQVSMG